MRLFFVLLLFTGLVNAENARIVGTIRQNIPHKQQSKLMSKHRASNERTISLLNVHLSKESKRAYKTRIKYALQNKWIKQAIVKYPQTVRLAMSHVPVLDQGSYGSCVTFANTAAVDAALNLGDFISQLCQLELGSYLQSNAYGYSGWDGSWADRVLNQMSLFGVVEKKYQLSNGCGGLTQYPLIGETVPSAELSISAYHGISQPLSDTISWKTILDPNQVITDRIDLESKFDEVKEALSAGDRLTFAVLLPNASLGTAGALTSYKAHHDTWAITPHIADWHVVYSDDIPAHEMIITGFDDQAVAVDDQGMTHQGLLILRNSWGSEEGDNGDFYMSYDYFKTFVLEIHRIIDSGR